MRTVNVDRMNKEGAAAAARTYLTRHGGYYVLDLGTITLPPRRGLLCRVVAWLRGLF